jgi:hypothetical protein
MSAARLVQAGQLLSKIRAKQGVSLMKAAG